MELCSDGHDEICYIGRKCPACSAIYARDDFEEKWNNASDEIKALEEKISDLESERE